MDLYPSCRYFREPDGAIGCREIQSAAEEWPEGVDSPIRVPDLVPPVVAVPSVAGHTSPVTDERPATAAPARGWRRRQDHDEGTKEH